MSDALWMPDRDVAGTQATIAANKRWQSRLFTSSGTWTVPADVGVIWIDGCGGGAGGGGGDPTPGGGGSGGQCGFALKNYVVCVTPGDVVTLTIGIGGSGGPAGSDGACGGASFLALNGVKKIVLNPGFGGLKGTSDAGGASTGALPYSTAGSNWPSTVAMPNYAPMEALNANNLGYFSSTAGGALNAPGVHRIGTSIASGVIYNVGAAGSAAGGGGGHGAVGPYTLDVNSGVGGANGAAGGNADGYGGGGGGGSGNSAGGNGSPGFIRIYCFSATTI